MKATNKLPEELKKKIRMNQYMEFVCPNCLKCYKHRTSVYTHLKNECGVGPKYFCEICQFSCKFHHVLQRHKLSLVHRRKEAVSKGDHGFELL